MTTELFPVSCFNILFAEVPEIQIGYLFVDEHSVRNFLPDKQLIKIEFPEVVGCSQQIVGIVARFYGGVVGRLFVLPNLYLNFSRSRIEQILVHRVLPRMIHYPARINRVECIVIVIGFERVANRVKQIVSFKGFTNCFQVPGFLLPVVHGIGPEFDFATLHPNEMPVVIGSVQRILSAFERIFRFLCRNVDCA